MGESLGPGGTRFPLKLMTSDRLPCDTWARSSRPGECLRLGRELSSTLITFIAKVSLARRQRMQTSRWRGKFNLSPSILQAHIYEVIKLK